MLIVCHSGVEVLAKMMDIETYRVEAHDANHLSFR